MKRWHRELDKLARRHGRRLEISQSGGGHLRLVAHGYPVPDVVVSSTPRNLSGALKAVADDLERYPLGSAAGSDRSSYAPKKSKRTQDVGRNVPFRPFGND